MKPTLLFATLSMILASPKAFASTELETLRVRCAEQERVIHNLEEQIQELQSGKSSSVVKAAAPAAKSTSVASAVGVHVVRPGESLERIARRSGCSVEQLAKANGMKLSAVIHPGQKLKVPGGASAPAAAVASSAPKAPAASPLAGKTHTIRQGETYASISRKYRVPIASLIAANPGAKPTSLRPGQVIRLSGSSPAAAPAPSTPAPAVKSAPQLAAAPAKPQPTPVARLQSESAPVSKLNTAPATTTISAPIPSAPATKAETAAAAPAPAPAAPAKVAEAAASNPSPDSATSPANPEKKIRSVTIEGEMTYGEFAATHGTDTDRLNDLNGLDLTNATVLAKGSELYVPAQP